MKELILIAIGAALVNNVVLSQFLGICDKSDLQIYPGTGRT